MPTICIWCGLPRHILLVCFAIHRYMQSLSLIHILQSPYTFSKARVVVQEMAEGAALDLLDKHLLTDQIVLDVGYDIESLKDESIRSLYHGETQTDHYGRVVPKSAHGSANLGAPVSLSLIHICGLTTILSPQIPYYINRRQSKDIWEPRSQGWGTETVEAVYNYVPMKNVAENLQEKYMGVQANFWTEWRCV